MRPLLAAMLAVAISLVLRLAGQRGGLANADTGTWLLALSIISLLAGLTWGLAASLGRPELASGAVQTAWLDDRIEKAAFDEAPIGSTLTSLDGRFTRVNRALCEMTGYSAEDLVVHGGGSPGRSQQLPVVVATIDPRDDAADASPDVDGIVHDVPVAMMSHLRRDDRLRARSRG
jgi:hypothetical protein